MIKWFIRNELREMKRSSMWEQSMGIKIFLGILFSILFLELIGGSLLLGKKFHEIFPDDDPVEKFNSFLLYGFSLGFLMRVFIQKVPVLTIQPYLHLPVKKSALVHYVLDKSLLSFFNFIPIVLFVPFIIFQMTPWYSGFQVTGYILAVFFMVMSVNFLSMLFKRNLSGLNWISGVIAVVLVGLALLDYYKIISVGEFSSLLFTGLLGNPIWILVPVVVLIAAYLLNYFTLINKLYPEDNVRFKKADRKDRTEIKYLKQFGEIGQYMQLEVRLFLRNKRPKSTLVFLPIFLLYGLIFYPQETYMEMTGMIIFVGVFMTGSVIMIYGQYILSWESSYFDGILTHVDDFGRYFRAKYYIMTFTTIAAFILTIPYAYYGIEIVFINLGCALYNIGIGTIYVLLLASNNKKRLDISQGSAFNYQGVSATQFLIAFPIMLSPLLVYLPFWAFGYSLAGIIAVGVIGIVAISFNKSLMNMVVNRFMKRRYIISEGFRAKN